MFYFSWVYGMNLFARREKDSQPLPLHLWRTPTPKTQAPEAPQTLHFSLSTSTLRIIRPMRMTATTSSASYAFALHSILWLVLDLSPTTKS